MEHQSVHIKPEINYGQLLNFIPTAIAIAGLVWWQSSFQTETREQLMATRQARETYIPVINALQKGLDQLTQRVQLMAESTLDTRKATADTLFEWQKTNNAIRDKLETIQVDIAVIKAQLPGIDHQLEQNEQKRRQPQQQ